MRKILLTALLAAGGLTASAQYLQNEGFKYWKKECGKTDQTSKYKNKVNAPAGFLQPRPGTETLLLEWLKCLPTSCTRCC